MKPPRRVVDGTDLLLTAILVVIGATWLHSIHIERWRLDDSFFGYTYARNLVEGNGFTFNGVKVLGTSAPLPVLLYSGICALLDTLDVKRVAEATCIVAILLSSVFLYLFVSHLTGMRTAGLVSAVSHDLNLFILMIFGHESILAILLVITAMLLQQRKQEVAGYLVLGLAFLCRAESAFVGLYMAYRTLKHTPVERRTIRLHAACVGGFFLPLLAWFSFSHAYFGRLLSNSFKFKLLQSAISGTDFLQGLVNFVRPVFASGTLGLEILPAMVVLGAIGLLGMMKNRDYLVLTLALGAAPIGFYCSTNIAFYPWFLFLPGLLLSMLAGLSLVVVADWLGGWQRPARTIGYSLFALSVVVILHASYKSVKLRVPWKGTTPYQTIGEYVRDHTPRHASIGYVEVGQIAYYGQRRIVDLTGMVSEGVVEHLRMGHSDWAYQQYEPDYVLDDPRFAWLHDFSRSAVKKDYELVQTFDFGSGRRLSLYERTAAVDARVQP